MDFTRTRAGNEAAVFYSLDDLNCKLCLAIPSQIMQKKIITSRIPRSNMLDATQLMPLRITNC